jgi:CHAT domain-containing protein
VDVHALSSPASGDLPLVSRFEVRYPLGLEGRAPADASRAGALVVGDPMGDLPYARREADLATRALSARGLAVTTLFGAQVTSSALGAKLRGASIVHWAGHASYAGEDGFESALPLADGGRFAVTDVLTLGASPRGIVLSACEASRSAGEAEGLGLAQAFLVAGADEVLAPVRPIGDALALAFAGALYAQGAADASDAGRGSLSSQARAATLRLREDQPSSDWSAYRVVTR